MKCTKANAIASGVLKANNNIASFIDEAIMDETKNNIDHKFSVLESRLPPEINADSLSTVYLKESFANDLLVSYKRSL